MDTRSKRELFFERVKSIVDTPTDDLIRNSKEHQKNGVLIYNEIKPKVAELKEYLSYLSLDNINALPEERFEVLAQKSKPIFDKLDEIKTTSKNQNQTDIAQKKNTVDFFLRESNQGGNGYYQRAKEEIWNIITQAIAIYSSKVQDNSIIESKRKELDDVIQSAFNSKSEIQSVLEAARVELSKGGVHKHSDIFGQQANAHEKNSTNWRKYATILLGINAVIIISILCLVIWAIDEKDQRIEVGIFGAALVSLFSYTIVLCVKNYFAEKHNQNISRHRANCLGTFNTFVDSADEERKAAVLLQATNTIFSHQKSGYLSKDHDATSPNPIIEIVKKVSPDKTA